MTSPQADDLSWLRRRDDPRVLEFLARENEFTARETADLADLETRLYRQTRSLIQETDRSFPARVDGYFYYHRTEEGQSYRIWARAFGSADGPEEVYLDENELAQPHEFCRVGAHAVSPDHRHLAVAYDTTGDEDYVVAIKDIANDAWLPDRIERAADELAWAEDGKTLLYVTRDAQKRSHRVYRHWIGFDASEDALVYEEMDEAFHVGLRKSRSRRFIFIEASSAITLDTFLVDAVHPDRPLVSVAPRVTGVENHAYDSGDALLIRTNAEAVNFRLLEAAVSDDRVADPAEWVELVPGRDRVTIESVEAFRDFRILVEREDGDRHLAVRTDRTGAGPRVDLELPVAALEVADNPAFDADRFRYVVSSLVQPGLTCEVDPATGASERLREEAAPGFEADRYVTERIWAEADDGVRVPISIVRPKETELDGSSACLLTGYGSYGISVEPSFVRHVIPLLDRGFVYAIAHVRGGGELGETWHEQGRMLSKRNTFADFIRCAETMIERGYTSAARLGIQGRSAGGLLVGAVTNQRPDLFGAVIAGVPFVDVLATMLDPSVPLTVIEYEEWGDPRNPEFYDYIRSYSPFDNVRETDYPHMLVTAGLNDPRVQFWEPARWVARLRERRTDHRSLLLKTDMGAGHLGPSDRFGEIRDKAFEFAFLIRALAPESVRE